MRAERKASHQDGRASSSPAGPGIGGGRAAPRRAAVAQEQLAGGGGEEGQGRRTPTMRAPHGPRSGGARAPWAYNTGAPPRPRRRGGGPPLDRKARVNLSKSIVMGLRRDLHIGPGLPPGLVPPGAFLAHPHRITARRYLGGIGGRPDTTRPASTMMRRAAPGALASRCRIAAAAAEDAMGRFWGGTIARRRRHGHHTGAGGRRRGICGHGRRIAGGPGVTVATRWQATITVAAPPSLRQPGHRAACQCHCAVRA